MQSESNLCIKTQKHCNKRINKRSHVRSVYVYTTDKLTKGVSTENLANCLIMDKNNRLNSNKIMVIVPSKFDLINLQSFKSSFKSFTNQSM